MKNRLIVTWLVGLCLIMLAASTIARAVENATLPKAPTLTHQQIILEGHPLKYNVTAGILPVYDAKGNETARMFYLAYTRDGLKNTDSRPVSFFFNGGPGVPSRWSTFWHLGLRPCHWATIVLLLVLHTNFKIILTLF